MRSMSVFRFRAEIKAAVAQVLDEHEPLRVTRRSGQDFVVVGAEDWEREQETLWVLQNRSLMAQIERSLATHTQGAGYQPRALEIDAIDRL